MGCGGSMVCDDPIGCGDPMCVGAPICERSGVSIALLLGVAQTCRSATTRTRPDFGDSGLNSPQPLGPHAAQCSLVSARTWANSTRTHRTGRWRGIGLLWPDFQNGNAVRVALASKRRDHAPQRLRRQQQNARMLQR